MMIGKAKKLFNRPQAAVDFMIEPGRELVLKKARQLFAPQEFANVISILDSYEGLARERVQLAALKLSDGNLDELRNEIENAKQDFRDALAWAESPNAMKAPT